MAGNTARSSVIEYPLGMLGLVLIGLTTWGVEQQQRRTRIRTIVARLVLAGVSAVGWTFDRLPSRPPAFLARSGRVCHE
jgi:hypothetical protein